MRELRLLLRPRTATQGRWWLPLVAVGLVAALGVSLAFGFKAALVEQARFKLVRDGQVGLEPARRDPSWGGRPLRASEVVPTAYGPLTRTTFVGSPGTPLPIPGVTKVGEVGTVLASPALLRQLRDDWTGELGAFIGPLDVKELPSAALAAPEELVLVEFLAAAGNEDATGFRPVEGGGQPEPVDSSLVIIGLAVLLFPSLALAVAGGRLHLSHRAVRYGLVRTLGMTRRKMVALILIEMAFPLAFGAIAGILALRAIVRAVPSIRSGGASYWTSDLLLDGRSTAVTVLAVVAFGVLASRGIVRAASKDPFAVFRHPRRGTRRWLALGAPLGLLLMVTASRAATDLSLWLLPLGLLTAVAGLVGSTRVLVSIAGRGLLGTRLSQVAGSRMLRSPAEATLGTAAAAVAILLVTFGLSANFTPRPPLVGEFDVVVDLPDVQSGAGFAVDVKAIPGVEDVFDIGRIVIRMNGKEMSLYTASCSELTATARLSATCADGVMFVGKDVEKRGASQIEPESPGAKSGVEGSYEVAGTVEAVWMSAREAVLASDLQTRHTQLLIETDGSTESLRALFVGLRDHPEVASVMTREALASGLDINALVAEPYLAMMVGIGGAVAAVALALAALLLLRQQSREFGVLRCLGSTGLRLAVDLATLFLVPLVIALALAMGLGFGMAAVYNVTSGVAFREATALGPVIGSVALSGALASLWVIRTASQIGVTVPDPDAIV